MNNIEEIKQHIKELIYKKNIIAHKYSFFDDDNFHKRALDKNEFDAFRISSDDLRKVDKKCTIDGKRMWLSKIVIDEMVANDELIYSKSYCAAKSHAYCKAYPLTWKRYKEVSDMFEVTSPKKERKQNVEWNPNDGFLTDEEFEYSSKDGRVTTEIYNDVEIKNFERQCEQEASYHKNLLKIKLEKENEFATVEWMKKGESWPTIYQNAISNYIKENA